LPAASLAARHYECPIRKAVVQISSQHFVDHPAGKTDHLHTGGHQSALQRRGNRAANENLGSQAQELGHACRGFHCEKPPLFTPHRLAIFHVDQQKIDCDIKDGSDAALPLWNRDSHR
jgi:hypothetical protein